MRLAPEGINLAESDHWDRLYDARDRNLTLYAMVKAVIRPKALGSCYWELELKGADGVRGLIPATETGLPNERMMNFFVGQIVNMKIKDIDRKNRIVDCSRKEIVDKARNYLSNNLREKEEIQAMVRFVSKSRLAVDIGGGVIVDTPYYTRSLPLDLVYKPGQMISATVKAIDHEKKEINIEINDPWEKENFNRGDIVTGTVLCIKGSELFVQVRQGLVGLAGGPADKKIKEQDTLTFQVTSFNKVEQKLHMALFDPDRIRGRRQRRARRKSH